MIRRAPGRPPEAWRPRKIVDDYTRVSEGHHKPQTRDGTVRCLREYEDFLRRQRVDSEDVSIDTIIAYERELVGRGFTSTRALAMARVRGYYLLKASASPGTRWSLMAGEIKAHRMPKTIGKRNPHQPLELSLLPTTLEAARAVVARGVDGEVQYNQAPVVVATLLYTGTRAQVYSLSDKQARDALKKKYIEMWTKEGEWVFVPVPDQLLPIWRAHLEARNFEGPMFFRHGRNPYTYQDGNKEWIEDRRSAHANEMNLIRMFRAIEKVVRERYDVRVTLTAHRFRKSVGTFMAKFGYDEDERRLQLSHGAKSITDEYDVADVEEAQKKLSKIDLGSAEWIRAHTRDGQPYNLFTDGNEDLRRQLEEANARARRAEERADRLETKLDELLRRSDVRVVA